MTDKILVKKMLKFGVVWPMCILLLSASVAGAGSAIAVFFDVAWQIGAYVGLAMLIFAAIAVIVFSLSLQGARTEIRQERSDSTDLWNDD